MISFILHYCINYHLHCPISNPNFRDITQNVEERYTIQNIPRSISFSPLHFVLYLGKSITFGTVYTIFRPGPGWDRCNPAKCHGMWPITRRRKGGSLKGTGSRGFFYALSLGHWFTGQNSFANGQHVVLELSKKNFQKFNHFGIRYRYLSKILWECPFNRKRRHL